MNDNTAGWSCGLWPGPWLWHIKPAVLLLGNSTDFILMRVLSAEYNLWEEKLPSNDNIHPYINYTLHTCIILHIHILYVRKDTARRYWKPNFVVVSMVLTSTIRNRVPVAKLHNGSVKRDENWTSTYIFWNGTFYYAICYWMGDRKMMQFFLSMETRGVLFKHPSFVVGVFKWQKRYIHGIYCVKFVFNWNPLWWISLRLNRKQQHQQQKKRNTSSLGCVGVLDFNEIEPFQFSLYIKPSRITISMKFYQKKDSYAAD